MLLRQLYIEIPHFSLIIISHIQLSNISLVTLISPFSPPIYLRSSIPFSVAVAQKVYILCRLFTNDNEARFSSRVPYTTSLLSPRKQYFYDIQFKCNSCSSNKFWKLHYTEVFVLVYSSSNRHFWKNICVYRANISFAFRAVNIESSSVLQVSVFAKLLIRPSSRSRWCQ